ncbi:hypothetical protein INT47_012730 [Mucor saturninus]|uniref:Uncharacterized protein n=1 Tax=Mucor saturninus TaxID=64648 RepID=A0A8H7V370_9FUNG|nr:hypothetical protein INT47_012730 [Mucor saturninus]
MSDQPFHSFGGGRGGGRGRGRGGNRGGFNRGGRGRGGFHNNNHHSKQYTDVDYSPEAIEARFSAYYSPSITKDPWSHLIQEHKDDQ